MAYVRIPQDQIEIQDRLAHGGFGTVYKGVRQNQTIAIKRVEAKEAEHELKFLAELDHPNIVKLLGMAVVSHFETDIILEFCDGGSLREYLNAHRGTRLGQLFFDWTTQVGRPIAYLRTKGVVHKDIKSPNYLITNGNILKLCDFGLAKKMDATMTNATDRASYPWMAPELLKDNILSPTYDIFAFGVVVWELWTTDVPFEDAHVPTNLIWRICEKNERPPIPQDCSKQIADLMKQCWETDWTRRPSMDQALSTLQSAKVLFGWKLSSKENGPRELRGARDIAVSPYGDNAVLDCWSNKVHVWSNERTFNLDLKHGVTSTRKASDVPLHPMSVTINVDGTLYVSYGYHVLMYEGAKYLGRWVARGSDNKPSDTANRRLYGLTIDRRGRVLVGLFYYKPGYISTHTGHGDYIGSIKVSIIPYHLATTSRDTIIVSDGWQSVGTNTVQVVNSTGEVLHTLNADGQLPFWNPMGVCIFNDNILVCNSDKKDAHEISCFSVCAEYLGSIPVQKKPYGVTAAKDGSKLLLACETKVLIYRSTSASTS